MNNAGKGPSGPAKTGFPWITILLLLLGIYLFWILPYQLGPRRVQVEYEPAKSTK